MSDLEKCILELYECSAVKFGSFTLKSGIQSPFYLDLRVIISFPKLLNDVSRLMWEARSADFSHDRLCGVPYTALPIASIISVKHNIPMIIRRKEVKSYGTKKILEGSFNHGEKCLIFEDVIVSGSSVVETVEVLKKEGLQISEVVVFVDREQGGQQNLKERGIKVTSVVSMTKIVEVLRKHSKLTAKEGDDILGFISKSRVKLPPSSLNGREKLSLESRINVSSHPLVKKLFSIVIQKESNLCVAADYSKASDLLHLADLIGPHICILKTHIDILDDFTTEVTDELKKLSLKHNFLIFEDRKFSDIGNTVRHQYSGSNYMISSWSDIVTIHALPGDGVIQGLKLGSSNPEQGCLIVAEMSSAGNLCSEKYVEESVKIAEKHPDFVVGFVAQNNITSNPKFIIMTPGVNLEKEGDQLGQQYKTPDVAIDGGSDFIIVGRGITQAEDPKTACQKYQKAAFSALKRRFS